MKSAGGEASENITSSSSFRSRRYVLLFIVGAMVGVNLWQYTPEDRASTLLDNGTPIQEDLPLCANTSLVKTQKLTLWTMLEGTGTAGELNSLLKMVRRANLKLRDPFTPWVLEHKDKLMSTKARKILLKSGWNICTLVNGFNNSQLALRALWGMRGIDRIIYLDSKSYISGDINALARMPLEGVKLAAPLKYDGSWTTYFSTSTMVLSPSESTVSRLNRMSSQMRKGTSFETFINEIYPSRWYDLGYRFSVNTDFILKNPDYLKYKSAHFRIITFQSAPWDVCRATSEQVICDWWTNEKDADGMESRYEKLFLKRVQNFAPVQQSPYPGTLIPALRNLTGARLQLASTQDETGYILTADRRKKRISPLFAHVREDLFPNDADYKKHWVVAFGIPSVDTTKGAYFRKLQRDSFLRYSRVWNHHKRPDATILAKYLLAYHPSTQFTYSPELLEEAKITKDILFFNLKEGNWTGVGGKSNDVLIGMSRKSYAFYSFVAGHVKADYICKGDDDAFYRLNMLANELDSFTFPMIYHGRAVPWYGISRTSGLLVTMSFDMADWVRDSTLVRGNIDFKYEDVMVGRWFFLANMRFNFLSDCRGHCINRGYGWQILQNITDTSMVLHGILPTSREFTAMMKRFPDAHLAPLKLTTEPSKELDEYGNTVQELGECPLWPSPINYYEWGGECNEDNCSLPRKPTDPLLRR